MSTVTNHLHSSAILLTCAVSVSICGCGKDTESDRPAGTEILQLGTTDLMASRQAERVRFALEFRAGDYNRFLSGPAVEPACGQMGRLQQRLVR